MAMRQEALAARIPFSLPPELEAREPAEVRGRGRDDVRLLVTTGPHGESRHARFVELDGSDHWAFAGDQQPVLASIRQFVGSLPA